MARIYARAKFSVTGVTSLCDYNLSVILGNLLASRAGHDWVLFSAARHARILAGPKVLSRCHSLLGQGFKCDATTIGPSRHLERDVNFR
jgi:hypothetical protein